MFNVTCSPVRLYRGCCLIRCFILVNLSINHFMCHNACYRDCKGSKYRVDFGVCGAWRTKSGWCVCVSEQLAIQMDVLEEYLKIEKLDPTQVPDAAIKHKEESFVKMTDEFSSVESSGKQFVKEATDVRMINFTRDIVLMYYFRPFHISLECKCNTCRVSCCWYDRLCRRG